MSFVEIMRNNGIELTSHFTSKERNMEDAFGDFEVEIAIYKIIEGNGLIQSENDMATIIEQLKEQYKLKRYENEGVRRYSISSEEQMQYFLKRMKEKGLDLTQILEEDGREIYYKQH